MAISQRDVVHERRHWLEFLIFGILVSSSFAADAITPEVQWPRFSVGGSGAMVMEGGRIYVAGSRGLGIIDATNTTALKWLGFWELPESTPVSISLTAAGNG